jgi:hypothetical protein
MLETPRLSMYRSSRTWRRLSIEWKRLPGIDRRLQSPAFGQVGGIPSIPLQRLRSLCLYGVGGLVQRLHKPMPCEQMYNGANLPCDSPSWICVFLQCAGISLPSLCLGLKLWKSGRGAIGESGHSCMMAFAVA